MFKIFKKAEKKPTEAEEVIYAKPVQEVEVIDYFNLLQNTIGRRRSEAIPVDALKESPTEELIITAVGILSHSQLLTRQLGWSLANCTHLNTLVYGSAVTCILADILHNIPRCLVIPTEEIDDDARERLISDILEYFNFMGVLYDHLEDSEVDITVKDTVRDYYKKYITASFMP